MSESVSSKNDNEISFGFYDREALRHLIRRVLRPNVRMLEIGSWLGEGSTQVFIDELRAVDGRMHCVDTWEGTSNVEHHQEFAKGNDPFARFVENLEKANAQDIVQPLKMTSLQAVDEFDDGMFDLVFIDGDHSKKSTKQDISAWIPKVRAGGILCGHDCEGRVTESNREFLERNSTNEEDCVTPQGRDSSFLVIHPGVILAVDEMFDGKAHLWAEDLVVFSNGGVGPATLWDIQVSIVDQSENQEDAGTPVPLKPAFHGEQDHNLSLHEVDFLGHKVEKFNGRYYGIPFNSGDVDLYKLSPEQRSFFLSARSFDELKTRLIRDETMFLGHEIVRFEGRYYGLSASSEDIVLAELSSEKRSTLPNAASFDELRQILVDRLVKKIIYRSVSASSLINKLRKIFSW